MAKTLAVVANPTKLDDTDATREALTEQALASGWDELVWFESTPDDPGAQMAQDALDRGVDLVCALGGDGTVRAVASALVGTDTPLGLLPGGTGNLLARNLDLPLDSIEDALAIALTGHDKRVDVGMVRLDELEPEPFLVIAGAGIDAEVMDTVDEKLKKKLGWLAYAVSGVQFVAERGFQMRLQGVGDGRWHRARSVMVCNCGQLTGGFTIAPEALPDDGVLDVIQLSPRGPLAWLDTIWQIVRRRRDSDNVDHWSTERVTVELHKPVIAQLDGDSTNPVSRIESWVRPGALVVRVAG